MKSRTALAALFATVAIISLSFGIDHRDLSSHRLMTILPLRWDPAGRTFATNVPGQYIYTARLGQRNVLLADGSYAPYSWDKLNNTIHFANADVRLRGSRIEFLEGGKLVRTVEMRPQRMLADMWVSEPSDVSSIRTKVLETLEPTEYLILSYDLISAGQRSTVTLKVGGSNDMSFGFDTVAIEPGTYRLAVVQDGRGLDDIVLSGEKVGFKDRDSGYYWMWYPSEINHRVDSDDSSNDVLIALNERDYTAGQQSRAFPDIWGTNVGIEETGDDGDENVSTSAWTNNSSTNIFGTVSGNKNHNDGLRWNSLTIPSGSTIDSTSIQIYWVTNTGSPSANIQAWKTANAGQFDGTNRPSTVTLTTASVAWSISSPSTLNEYKTSSDAKTVTQEIIDQGGWSTGNSINYALITSSANGVTGTFYDYSNGANAPLLSITYTRSVPLEIPQWYASSTSFFVHRNIVPLGSLLHSGSSRTESYSTSTTFKLTGAGGETAIGTSTSASFGLLGGFIRNLYYSPVPTYTQIHYHWRNNNGIESAATSKTGGVQDTDITSLDKSTAVRLRVEIANKGGTKLSYTAQQFRLEYGLKSTTCADIASWTDVGAVAGDWDMYDSSDLTEGNDTTNIAVSIGGVDDGNHTFKSTNAAIKDMSSTVAATSLSSEEFIEIEYSIQALSAATDSGTYCFRVTNAGSATNYSYTVYPQATLSAGGGGYLYFSLDGSTEAFGNVTPAVIAATSSILTARTDNATGFNITVNRDDSVGTMSSGSIYIPDKTAWIPGVDTSTAGNATASTTEPQTLQFRIRNTGTDTENYSSAWWGASDTTAAALFAGIPSTAKIIVDRSSSAVATTTAYVLYNLTVPVTQKSGAYTGGITYTITANP